MKFFVIKATARPQNPLPKKVEIRKSNILDGDNAKRIAEARGFDRFAEVVRWWEFQHSQCILCEIEGGTFLELQSR